MTLKEMKEKVLSLIEELNPESPYLTEDGDIAAKLNGVINQILFELARFKKLPKYCEIPVSAGDLLDFGALERACGYEVYQLGPVRGVRYIPKAEGTVLKILESGTAEIDLFVYPERITEKTKDSYEFELSSDVLEIMPYGVAGDLLKSDASSDYGNLYAARYQQLLQTLDHRYQLPAWIVEGGVDVG